MLKSLSTPLRPDAPSSGHGVFLSAIAGGAAFWLSLAGGAGSECEGRPVYQAFWCSRALGRRRILLDGRYGLCRLLCGHGFWFRAVRGVTPLCAGRRWPELPERAPRPFGESQRRQRTFDVTAGARHHSRECFSCAAEWRGGFSGRTPRHRWRPIELAVTAQRGFTRFELGHGAIAACAR